MCWFLLSLPSSYKINEKLLKNYFLNKIIKQLVDLNLLKSHLTCCLLPFQMSFRLESLVLTPPSSSILGGDAVTAHPTDFRPMQAHLTLHTNMPRPPLPLVFDLGITTKKKEFGRQLPTLQRHSLLSKSKMLWAKKF